MSSAANIRYEGDEWRVIGWVSRDPASGLWLAHEKERGAWHAAREFTAAKQQLAEVAEGLTLRWRSNGDKHVWVLYARDPDTQQTPTDTAQAARVWRQVGTITRPTSDVWECRTSDGRWTDALDFRHAKSALRELVNADPITTDVRWTCVDPGEEWILDAAEKLKPLNERGVAPCSSGKLQHRTVAEAREHERRTRSRDADTYRCPECGALHVTTRSYKKLRKRIKRSLYSGPRASDR